MKKPNLFIIGAAKSGTTALNDYIIQHPHVFMAPKKESNYFAFKDLKKPFNGPGDIDIREFQKKQDYLSLFEGAKNEKIIGESSVWNLYYPNAAKNLYSFNPDAKIIVILRNPVDRAHSSYWYLRGPRREKETDFKKALDLEEDRIRLNWEPIWHYKKAGLYAEQLIPFYEIFHKDQLKIFTYENFKKNNLTTLKEICEFLNVPFSEHYFRQVNPKISGDVESEMLKGILNYKQTLKKIVPSTIWDKMKKKYLKKPALPLDIKEYLSEYFFKDIERLQLLTGESFYPWKK